MSPSRGSQGIWKQRACRCLRTGKARTFLPVEGGASQRQVEKAISYAALRYNKDLHVENVNLNDEIDLFALREKRTEVEKKLQEIEANAINNFGTSLAKYSKGDYERLFGILKEWRNNHSDSSKWAPDEKTFLKKHILNFNRLLKSGNEVKHRYSCSEAVQEWERPIMSAPQPKGCVKPRMCICYSAAGLRKVRISSHSYLR